MRISALPLVIGLSLALFAAPSPVSAQNGIDWGQSIITSTPRESVITAGLRAPGTMVNAGVARTLTNTRLAQSPIEITEQLEPDVIEGVREEARDIIVEQVTAFFFYFTNLILERAGLPPLEIPTPLPDDDTDTSRPDKPGTR